MIVDGTVIIEDSHRENAPNTYKLGGSVRVVGDTVVSSADKECFVARFKDDFLVVDLVKFDEERGVLTVEVYDYGKIWTHERVIIEGK